MKRKKIFVAMTEDQRHNLMTLIPNSGFNDDVQAIMCQPRFEFENAYDDYSEVPVFICTPLTRVEYEAVAAALNPDHTDLSRLLRDYGFTEGTFSQRMVQALTELKHLREQAATAASMQLELTATSHAPVYLSCKNEKCPAKLFEQYADTWVFSYSDVKDAGGAINCDYCGEELRP